MKQITAILPMKQTVACVINNHFFSLFILRQTLSAALMGLREQKPFNYFATLQNLGGRWRILETKFLLDYMTTER